MGAVLRTGFVRRSCLALALWLASFGCGPSDDGPGAAPDAVASLADRPGAVCGMIVEEQPAPRAQVVHRDGERAFLCSIGDLLVYLDAPSPHGSPRVIFVEVLDPEADPLGIGTGEHLWQDAEAAHFVVGVDRPGIMGEPVLSYADPADAARVAARHQGARHLDLEGLRTWWRTRQREP